MYRFAWKKYLSVIRILVKRSAASEQVLTVNRSDFEKANRSRKNAGSFALESNKGKLTPVHPIGAGKDLIDLLLDDAVLRPLLRSNHYVFNFTVNFELHIKNITVNEVAGDEIPADTVQG